MTNAAYFHEIRKMLESHGSRTLKNYFEGHIQRFELTLDMFRKALPAVESVFDVGTGFPFVSMYFKWVLDADVAFACMEEPNAYPDGVSMIDLNLNRCDEISPYKSDLVICTECLEHLPRRHDVVIDWICSCADRALFVSVPMNGDGAAGHFEDLDMDFDVTYSEHLREYSPDTIGILIDRIRGNGFTVVDMRSIHTTHYQAEMRHILFMRG